MSVSIKRESRKLGCLQWAKNKTNKFMKSEVIYDKRQKIGLYNILRRSKVIQQCFGPSVNQNEETIAFSLLQGLFMLYYNVYI